jgi:hypothetical protein
MAVGIDVMFVAVELLNTKARWHRMSDALTIITPGISGYLNSLAMSHGTFDLGHANAICLGLFIPQQYS